MKPIKRLFRSIPVLLLATVPCAVGEASEGTARFHFQAVSLERFEGPMSFVVAEEAGEILREETRLKPFRIASRGRPPAYRASRGKTLFFLRVRDSESAGEPELEILGRYQVPKDVGRALFVFIADPDASNGVRLKAVDLTGKRSSNLVFLTVNDSPEEIAVRLPDFAKYEVMPESSETETEGLESAIRLPSGSLLEVRADDYKQLNTPATGETISTMKTGFHVHFEGAWRPLNRDLIGLRENELRVVVFGAPAVSGSHYLRSAAFYLDQRLPRQSSR